MFTMPRLPVATVKSLGVFAAVLLLLLPPANVRAQILELKSWEIDESLAAKKADYFAAFKSGSVDSDRAALDQFFDTWYFARWTALDVTSGDQKVSAGQTNMCVRELFQDFPNVTGNAREYFLKKTFETLQKMAADGKVHPSARYNAVLVIGQLAQREASGRNAPPVLYAASLPWLIESYQKEGNPEYLKLAALLGIVRHTKTGIADETIKTVTVPDLLLSVLETGKPAQGVAKDDQDIKDWFRHIALDGLGGLKSVGPNGKVVTALDRTMNNASESLEMRTKAARVLGDLDYAAANASGTTLNYQQIGTTLVTLMKTVADSELQSVKQIRDKTNVARGQVNIGPGTIERDPEFSTMPLEQQIEVEAVLQSVKSNVQNVVYGLRGTRFSGNTATQGVFMMLDSDDAVAKKINATMNKAVNPLIKKLDEGPPEEKRSAAIGMSDDMSGSELMGGGTAKKTVKDEKKIKVNLLDIRDALQEFSTEMGAIIAGSDT